MPTGIYKKVGSRRIKDSERYTIDKKTHCWNYVMSLSSGGYGQYYLYLGKYKYKVTTAHRHFYENKYGKLAPGIQLDHLCRNRSCVNPDHLEPVSAAENKRRGIGIKLNYEAVKEIKKRYRGGELQDHLAKVFDVNQSQISRVIHGLRWG